METEPVKKNILQLMIKYELRDGHPNSYTSWDIYHKTFCFQLPSSWFVGKEIPGGKLSLILDYLEKEESRHLIKSCRFVILKTEQKYISPEDWLEEGYRAIVIGQPNGEFKLSGSLQLE